MTVDPDNAEELAAIVVDAGLAEPATDMIKETGDILDQVTE